MDELLNTPAPGEQLRETELPESETDNANANLAEHTDHSSKSLKEIVQLFQELLDRGDQQEMYKYADVLKASFYKALKREKIAAGFIVSQEVADSISEEVTDTEEAGSVSVNPFAELERGFKELYQNYKTLRTEFLQNLEKQKEENLNSKLQIIEELKELLEKQEDIQQTFPAFRELQNRWKSVGPVPQARNKDMWETYQYLIERFYDYVKINNELRDLDFKKNLEMKTELCEKAEVLLEEPNIIQAFKRLQKLHEEWREIGPVSKEMREEIWDRFREATSKINRKQQEHFEGQKEEQKENLEKKRELCDKIETLVNSAKEERADWNILTREVENIQSAWREIGFATKKENQRIYDRFRAACDIFYNAKRDHYTQFKEVMQENLEKKISLCEQAEALKDSQDWKRTTDQLITLQKRWKEIGPVARKHSDTVWKRFRAACDYFFDNKSKHFSSVDENYEQNLAKKLELIQDINEYKMDTKSIENSMALKDFQERWAEIGFVPLKDKERVQAAYRHALESKFGEIRNPEYENKINRFKKRIQEIDRKSV
ncbi:MAG: DUF349 domain-containing protein, partial [Bacteroidales bacterium]|nr:DUF349 domain-containing protein [Bacteroidales bacterium]